MNDNKYLTLVPTNESKETLKMYEKLCTKLRDLIKSKTNNAGNYNEKYVKMGFYSDDGLLLKKR